MFGVGRSKFSSVMTNCDRNLHFGWWSLLVFVSLGLALETLHGLDRKSVV